MKLILENWKKFVKQQVEDVLPDIEVRDINTIGSSVLSPAERTAQDLEKYGRVRDDSERDIDIEVQVAGASNEDVEKWAFSDEAQELEDMYNYDVQLRIVENCRKYLKEAKFENEATKMVRDVVKNIKDHLRAYDGEPRIKPRFGELEHPLETIVYDKKYFGGLPETLADQGINKVTFALEVQPSTAFGEGKKFGVDGKTFTYDDDFGKGEIVKDRQVRVNVYLSDEFTMKDMSSLIEKMKDTAVHEITHGGQPTDVLRKSGQAQMKAFQHGLTSLEALRLYYLEPAETEAYARGVYKRAKMSKVPFTTKLDEQIKELLGFYAHPKTLEKSDTQYTEEEVNNFFKKEYRQSIIDYAKETLPAAVIGAEEFNN